MYINHDEVSRNRPFPRENLTLAQTTIPILGGECDYPHAFFSGRESVYVPVNTVLERFGTYFLVNLEPDTKLNSTANVHKTRLEINPVTKVTRLEALCDKLGLFRDSFRVVEVPTNPFFALFKSDSKAA